MPISRGTVASVAYWGNWQSPVLLRLGLEMPSSGDDGTLAFLLSVAMESNCRSIRVHPYIYSLLYTVPFTYFCITSGIEVAIL